MSEAHGRRDGPVRPGDAVVPGLLGRILGFARPYVGAIVLVALFTLVFSAGRYGRAYLVKPLLDGVLVPVVGEADPPPADVFGSRPTAGSLDAALARVLPDEALAPPPLSPGGPEMPAGERAAAIRGALAHIMLAALLIVVVTPLALLGRGYLGAWALGRVHVDVQLRLADKLLSLPLARHVRGQMGDLLARLQIDVLAVRDTLRLVIEEFL
ncbi:MAG TPA: ABC transporter ATP-binding protein, partial [Alphaproteobacteria bacterium]|nr:ABC transporter ATP-binding protein [Alphaproteobacteria bacterium]